MTESDYTAKKKALKEKHIAEYEALRAELTKEARYFDRPTEARQRAIASVHHRIENVSDQLIEAEVALDAEYRAAGGVLPGDEERDRLLKLARSMPTVMATWRKYYFSKLVSSHENAAAHNFTNGSGESKCSWCGRTRQAVQYDDLPPECAQRPEMRHVEDVIRDEEQMYWDLLERGKKVIPAIVAKRGMSGETLAFLHSTHGYTPDVVEEIVPVPKELMDAYHAEREADRAVSRAARVVTVVSAVK